MDIAIIGGGIAGLSAAIVLQHNNIQPSIYEQTTSLQPLGAGIGIGSNAMLALQEMNVAQNILKHGMPLHEQRFYDGKGRLMNTIDFTQLKEQFGEETITIQRADLHQALLNKVGSNHVHFKKRVESFRQSATGVTLTFADGTIAQHDYVIAADGLHSIFRKKLFTKTEPRYAGYTCWRGISPNNGAVLDHISNETWSTRGRFGWAPLHNGDVYWFACINTEPNHPKYKNYSKRDVAQQLKHFSPTVERLILKTYDEYFLHHDLYDIKPLSKFHHERVLLIGDAAHATTPNMGQGAGQAIEDAYELMLAFQSEQTWKNICRVFNNKRVKKTKQVINVSRQIGWAAQWDSNIMVFLRDTIFPYVPKALLFWRLKFLFK